MCRTCQALNEEAYSQLLWVVADVKPWQYSLQLKIKRGLNSHLLADWGEWGYRNTSSWLLPPICPPLQPPCWQQAQLSRIHTLNHSLLLAQLCGKKLVGTPWEWLVGHCMQLPPFKYSSHSERVGKPLWLPWTPTTKTLYRTTHTFPKGWTMPIHLGL